MVQQHCRQVYCVVLQVNYFGLVDVVASLHASMHVDVHHCGWRGGGVFTFCISYFPPVISLFRRIQFY